MGKPRESHFGKFDKELHLIAASHSPLSRGPPPGGGEVVRRGGGGILDLAVGQCTATLNRQGRGFADGLLICRLLQYNADALLTTRRQHNCQSPGLWGIGHCREKSSTPHQPRSCGWHPHFDPFPFFLFFFLLCGSPAGSGQSRRLNRMSRGDQQAAHDGWPRSRSGERTSRVPRARFWPSLARLMRAAEWATPGQAMLLFQHCATRVFPANPHMPTSHVTKLRVINREGCFWERRGSQVENTCCEKKCFPSQSTAHGSRLFEPTEGLARHCWREARPATQRHGIAHFPRGRQAPTSRAWHAESCGLYGGRDVRSMPLLLPHSNKSWALQFSLFPGNSSEET